MIHRKGPWLYVKSCGTHWCSFFSHGLECFSGESNGSPLKGIASSGNSKESPAASAIDTVGVFSLDFGCAHQTMAQRRGETYCNIFTLAAYIGIHVFHSNMTCQSHAVVTSGANAQIEKYTFWDAFGSEKSSPLCYNGAACCMPI